MNRIKVQRLLVLASAALTCWLAPPVLAGSGETPQFRISNGEQAKECVLPPVVLLGNCTGTLVHERVVVYAAHCGKRQTVTLTHGRGSGVKLAVEKCNTNPRYGSASQENLDWAYCILKEPAKGWPIVPVVAGCEYEMVTKSGGEVVQAGFGKSNDGGPSFGTKRYGVSKITNVSGGKIRVGDHNGVIACPGDSGGPLLARLSDGSWRTIGITSTYNGRCGNGGMNHYADMKGALSWLEKDSGIDITPCFNDAQEWEPGPGCGGFFAGDMGSASGTWANKCEGTKISGLSTMCGEQGPDKEAPEASVELKKDGESAPVAPATVEVVAKVKDNVGVVSVELFLNDKSQGKLKKEPWAWEVEDLKAGDYEIKVVAKDKADNEAESDVVEFEVIKKPDEDDESGDGTKSDSETEDPTEDAGTEDAGTEDAGTEDAGTEDAGTEDDGSKGDKSKDGSSNVDEEVKDEGGCGCTTQDAPLPGAMLVAFLGLLSIRRKKS